MILSGSGMEGIDFRVETVRDRIGLPDPSRKRISWPVGHERRPGGLKAGFRKPPLIWALNCGQANPVFCSGQCGEIGFRHRSKSAILLWLIEILTTDFSIKG
jgi:hypothetical protein